MKIVAILVIGYFALGFFGTGFILEGMMKKPKKTQVSTAETPPLQIPLTLLLTVIFLTLPLVGYKRARKQEKFLHLGAKFWLWGPLSLFVAGVLTALGAFAALPTFFASS